MSIDATKIFNSAYNTASQFTKTAANSVESARDSILNYFNTNLPQSITSKISLVAANINDSAFSKFLEGYGTTPAQAGSIFLGAVSGNLLLERPITALVSLSAGILLTSNRTQLAMLAGSTVAGAAISLAGRAIRL